MILDGAFRSLLNLQISLGTLEKSLSKASTPEECWAVLNEVYREFGFNEVQMQLAGKFYTTATEQNKKDLMCSLEIPLSLKDRVCLIRPFNPIKQSPVLPFADVLQRTLVKFVAKPERNLPASEVELSTI